MMLTALFIAAALTVIALGVITIPNRAAVWPTTTPKSWPGVYKTAMTNPGPVRIPLAGAHGSGMPLVERCSGGREGYYGFALGFDIPVGSAASDNNAPVVRGVIVDGFAGVESGRDVFIDAAAAPDPEAAFSGLTHTVPAGGRAERIGVGVGTTKIAFD
jgi:hypothetical protein